MRNTISNEQLRLCPNCQQPCINWQKFSKNKAYICQNCHTPIKAKPIFSTIVIISLAISTAPIFLYAKTKTDLLMGIGLTLILMLAVYLLSAKLNALFSPLSIDKK
ncbi:MAG: hypothetical protein Q4B88_03965 [Moraxella sp.]|nr:hypothetical protein [Moraxella sp.]